jgi:hypothetical protein
MSTQHWRKHAAWAAVAALAWATAVWAADKAGPDKDAADKAEKAVKDHLAKVKGDAGRVEVLKDEPLYRAFAGKGVLVSVVFPQYPVARLAPEGLSAANVFLVDADGKVSVARDRKGLEELFKGSVSGKSDDAARDAARAWVLLDAILYQDGFYGFSLMDDSTKVATEKGQRTASAKVVVMKGGNGEVNGALTFDEDGKLARATEEAKLKPGPRPICQATKLLDPDPIVRAIAEQDLLYMGRFAKPYLDEQRAKATPELQKAIDAIWERICERDR